MQCARICSIKHLWIISSHHWKAIFCCYDHRSNRNKRWLRTDSLAILLTISEPRFVTAVFCSVFRYKVWEAYFFSFAARSFWVFHCTRCTICTGRLFWKKIQLRVLHCNFYQFCSIVSQSSQCSETFSFL